VKIIENFSNLDDGELSFDEFLHLAFEMGFLTEAYDISPENEQNLRILIEKLIIKYNF